MYTYYFDTIISCNMIAVVSHYIIKILFLFLICTCTIYIPFPGQNVPFPSSLFIIKIDGKSFSIQCVIMQHCTFLGVLQFFQIGIQGYYLCWPFCLLKMSFLFENIFTFCINNICQTHLVLLLTQTWSQRFLQGAWDLRVGNGLQKPVELPY